MLLLRVTPYTSWFPILILILKWRVNKLALYRESIFTCCRSQRDRHSESNQKCCWEYQQQQQQQQFRFRVTAGSVRNSSSSSQEKLDTACSCCYLLLNRVPNSSLLMNYPSWQMSMQHGQIDQHQKRNPLPKLDASSQAQYLHGSFSEQENANCWEYWTVVWRNFMQPISAPPSPPNHPGGWWGWIFKKK